MVTVFFSVAHFLHNPYSKNYRFSCSLYKLLLLLFLPVLYCELQYYHVIPIYLKGSSVHHVPVIAIALQFNFLSRITEEQTLLPVRGREPGGGREGVSPILQYHKLSLYLSKPILYTCWCSQTNKNLQITVLMSNYNCQHMK
jgi:hypothetical protein